MTGSPSPSTSRPGAPRGRRLRLEHRRQPDALRALALLCLGLTTILGAPRRREMSHGAVESGRTRGLPE